MAIACALRDLVQGMIRASVRLNRDLTEYIARLTGLQIRTCPSRTGGRWLSISTRRQPRSPARQPGAPALGASRGALFAPVGQISALEGGADQPPRGRERGGWTRPWRFPFQRVQAGRLLIEPCQVAPRFRPLAALQPCPPRAGLGGGETEAPAAQPARRRSMARRRSKRARSAFSAPAAARSRVLRSVATTRPRRRRGAAARRSPWWSRSGEAVASVAPPNWRGAQEPLALSRGAASGSSSSDLRKPLLVGAHGFGRARCQRDGLPSGRLCRGGRQHPHGLPAPAGPRPATRSWWELGEARSAFGRAQITMMVASGHVDRRPPPPVVAAYRTWRAPRGNSAITRSPLGGRPCVRGTEAGRRVRARSVSVLWRRTADSTSSVASPPRGGRPIGLLAARDSGGEASMRVSIWEGARRGCPPAGGRPACR